MPHGNNRTQAIVHIVLYVGIIGDLETVAPSLPHTSHLTPTQVNDVVHGAKMVVFEEIYVRILYYLSDNFPCANTRHMRF